TADYPRFLCGARRDRSPLSPDWRHGAVIDRACPRSLADSDGDGPGDLPGLGDRLLHLAGLRAGALRLSPFPRAGRERSTGSSLRCRFNSGCGAAQIQPRRSAIATASSLLRAPVLPIAADRWLRTVPSARCRRAAISAALAPHRAAASTSLSRPVSGLAPCVSDSAARSGSTTRSPRCTRRTASTRYSGVASLTTNPLAPAARARARYPGRSKVVHMSTRQD